ncbi:MAG TPA: arginase family protein [Chloroflexaceae bacterium]|nr:arginase family protein [Chloroflexaceae bacterium]
MPPINSLHVVGVRYLDGRPAEGGEVPLDSYVGAALYWEAGLPVVYEEPDLPAARRTGDRIADLGLVCAAVGEQVAAGLRAGRAVLVTGGNCSHSVGVLAGLQRAHGPQARIGMVWLDAHGDYNTPNTTRSGMLGGMPVAVCAGLGQARWRELAGVQAPLPTERIVLVDVRNLDPDEERLIRATETTIAAAAPGRPGADLGEAVAELADRCDLIYLHVDSDILDAALTPNHGTREPDGIDLAQAAAAMETVLATGKVAATAVVAVFGTGAGHEVGVASGAALIRAALAAWRRHGQP